MNNSLVFIILSVLAITIAFMVCGCGSGDDCEDYDVPSGYYEFDRYSEGDYESVTYYNGSNRWINYTSTDNGCKWDKGEYSSSY